MGQNVGAELDTLHSLERGLQDNGHHATTIKTALDSFVANTVWTGPNADTFRSDWQTFRPTLDRLAEELEKASAAVRRQGTALAAATGATY